MDAEKIEFTKMLGGGESWYYLFYEGKVIGAADEDDREAMKALYERYKALKAEENS